MTYKQPVSVLVVIYAKDTGRVLMLQRRDDPDFWQSVTGSLEQGETASQAAMREVKEEVAIDVASEQLTLIDCQRTVEFVGRDLCKGHRESADVTATRRS